VAGWPLVRAAWLDSNSRGDGEIPFERPC